MSNLQWFPFYATDYVQDTMRLTTAQHGAYLLLLLEEWSNGPLPDDAGVLARLVRTEKRTFSREIWPGLKRYFVHDEDGNLINERIEFERRRAAEISQKRAEAGRARHRKTKIKEEQIHSKPTALAEASADTNASHSTQYTDSSSLRSEDASPPAPPIEVGPPLPPDERQILFQAGLDCVARLTGKPAARCRPIVGKWLKRCHDDARQLNGIIAEAVENRPADPIAWITGALNHRNPEIIDAAAEAFGLADVDLDAPLRAWQAEQERQRLCLH